MKKILIALFVAGIFLSCNRNTPKVAAVTAPIDSLITNYNNAWNRHDTTALKNLFAADALLIDDKIVAKNLEEINKKWIIPFYQNVSNPTSSKMQEWSSTDRAGFTGNWGIDMTINKKVMKAKGVYTIVWMKNDKGEWKITTADIHSAPGK